MFLRAKLSCHSVAALLLRRLTAAVHLSQVLADEGLGAFCADPQFVRTASRELQEAINMTPEQMDRAAHALLSRSPQSPSQSPQPPR